MFAIQAITSRIRTPFLVVIVLILLYLGIWNLASLRYYGSFHRTVQGIGSCFGIAGYCLFSGSLLLSSRWRKLEDLIGGLDQVYHLHRVLGISGFCMILIHPLVEAMRWLPYQLSKFFLMPFPIHGRESVNLGSIAFWMAVFILGITLLQLLPYDRWKIVHKFMTLVFIVATFHVLLSRRRFGPEFAHNFILFPMSIGLLGIFLKQIYNQFFAKRHELGVKKVRHLNDKVLEIELEPLEKFNFIPGQFGFFSFHSPKLTREYHPFTLIGLSGEGRITILVKASGDFTKKLYSNLREGCSVRYEGPYGRFDYSQYTTSQIWIAGGVGIVPFIAWIRSMKDKSPEKMNFDLYYCVHRKIDAVFYDEFQRFEKEHPEFRCFLHCTEENNRLDVQKIVTSSYGIEGKKIFMCGPPKLTRSFSKELQDMGVALDDIIFEEFDWTI